MVQLCHMTAYLCNKTNVCTTRWLQRWTLLQNMVAVIGSRTMADVMLSQPPMDMRDTRETPMPLAILAKLHLQSYVQVEYFSL
mmetsp:Transcript_95967/g.185096  ORF Transcript_95967/g.185096 Transcript_95967/m.185096 type:complete len:83 (-) Transcript_95967:588-836(-)